MKKLIILFAISICLALNAMVFSQGNLGQSGANFLQIAVEPRGAALGGAITAITDGAAALYWNPAGAIHTKNLDINFSHTNWFLDTKLMYVGVVKNLNRIGAIGISFTSFYMDELEVTTVYDSEGQNSGTWDAGDLAVGLSYARSLTDRFTFGVTAKLVREEIWNLSSSQLAFDVGSLYRTDFLNLRLGMAVRNFSGKMKFDGAAIDQRIQEEVDRGLSNNPRIERLTPEFRLPQVFQLGVAFDPISMESGSLTLLADVTVPSDNQELLVFGAEYQFQNFAFIRGAYRVDNESGDFSVGGGLNLNVAGFNSRFDYSYSTMGVLGNVHRFGLGLALK
jgi:hypothetical protein